MKFLKKNWKNLVFVMVLALLVIPQTAMPIKVFVSRLTAMSPSEVGVNETSSLNDYSWTLMNLEGEQVDFRKSESKVVLLNFWATWCPPCVAEMPSLQRLYDLYGDRVDFYFISSEKPEILQRFLQKKKYNLPVFTEIEAAPTLFQTTSIPRTFLISQTGKIVIDETGAAKWDSEKMKSLIEKLLSE
jgi:thiol-disulfide isomerase/thioredoxin